MTTLLDFVAHRAAKTQKAIDATPPAAGASPDPPALYYVYPLDKEPSVLLTRPLFTLILRHLQAGSSDAQELARLLQETAGA